jgi:hypothetical protein
MVCTYAAEFGWTGSESTRAFQTLLAGNTVQFWIVGVCARSIIEVQAASASVAYRRITASLKSEKVKNFKPVLEAVASE